MNYTNDMRVGWKVHRLKDLFDGVISAVDDFLTIWIQTL